MNPVESIQNKTNQMTDEIKDKIKKEFALWVFENTDDLIRVLLYIIFFLSSIIFFFMISFFLFIFKGLTDFHGTITYGSSLTAFVAVSIVSLLLSFIVKVFMNRKYKEFKVEKMSEFDIA